MSKIAKHRQLFILFSVVAQCIVDVSLLEYPLDCDESEEVYIKDGIVSKSYFPWIGVLQISFQEETSLQPLMTGLILIKKAFAIGNAVDVATVPPMVIMSEGEAVFCPENEEKYFRSPIRKVLIHPNYGTVTFNTLALLELGSGKTYPPFLKPICWTQEPLEPSKKHFYMSFTDEHQIMEKMVYSMNYVDTKTCANFYKNMVGDENAASWEKDMFLNNTNASTILPANSFCATAPDNSVHCDWENGVALATNHSGVWNLVGMGIRGPGCGSPARFLDIHEYLPWIDANTATYTKPSQRQEHSMKNVVGAKYNRLNQY